MRSRPLRPNPSLPSWASSAALACALALPSVTRAEGEPSAPPAPPAAAAPASSAAPAPQSPESKAKAEAAFKVIAASASAIDACSARYTGEFPDRKGIAKLEAEVSDGGRVMRANVKTELRAADRLEACLRAVAMGWRFDPATDGNKIGLPVPIEKGKKVQLLRPGEKPAGQEKAPEPPAEPGMINLGAGFGSP
jgi:hypothetical protein